ncbi:MAG: haloacid dehalogenase-like hydrolase [Candidatus Omnitrophica bacterium]|nr:haloacid dehalogenase-like hydrolase [Candidatus Omnitrophota bacterium]MBU4478533.1 haloacid dehalogenase-like hydrolase [Candidatus Omnitrophota bacterium]MCG2702870.1 haloacid dehalogenase-like hydrolase [Candidatus Omnitrophota bacterium]
MNRRIAVVFDFDETLSPDSTSSFLESMGIDAQDFWVNKVNPLYQEHGWDPIPAYLYMMIRLSESQNAQRKITKQKFQAFGEGIKFFNGVCSIFKQLEEKAREINPKISVDFFLISSGIRDILIKTKIAKYFKDIWACDFHYNRKGEIVFPKNIVSFTDKTRYLFHISKGLYGPGSRCRPFDVNRRIPREKMYVPFNQMIIVGDGQTDVPVFSLIEKYGGVAIAVYDPADNRKWRKAWEFVEENRVKNIVPADYGKRGALNHTLMMAIESIASRLTVEGTAYYR